MDLSGFNAGDAPAGNNYDPLPKGWYSAVIIESEEKATKAGTGSYLQLTIEVIDGEFKGRKLWDRLNLNNPNSVAVEIAQRTLGDICRAVNTLAPKDSSDLHDKPLAVRVGIDKNDPDRNEVKGYRALKNAATAPSSVPKGAAAPKASTPPWQRKAG